MARRFVGLAWLALLGASIASTTLADDPPGKLLDETQARIKLAKSALASTIESALSKAGKLPGDAAILVLQSAENDVNEANYLTAEEKKGYLNQLAAKRKSLDTGFSKSPAKPSKPPTKDEMQESEMIRQEIAAIKALEKQGHSSIAKSRMKALQDKYPNNPTLMAFASVTSRQESTKDQSRITGERRNSEGAALSDIDRSSGNVPTNGISYDKDHWAKISDPKTGRKPFGDVYSKLSGREKLILAALDQLSKTDFDLNEASFDQVLKMLEKELGFNLIISKATMEEVRITYESKLTYQIPRNVSKRTLLKSVLAELGLTYIIKGELLQVVSFLQAKSEHRVGMISIGTMMRPGSNVDDTIKLIKTLVEPDSWDTSGGTGTITFQPPGALIIKNSAEVIYQLGAKPK